MSSTPPKCLPSPEFSLDLLTGLMKDGQMIVEANITPPTKAHWKPKPESDSKGDYTHDSRFNISLVLGNENGHFKWGRSAFEKSGKKFEIVDGHTLKGELLDLQGVYRKSKFDLRKKLKVTRYFDQGAGKYFHKLSQKAFIRPERTLVLCFDGTSNHFDDRNTNVVKLVDLLKKDDPERQMVYYQTGVGTYGPPGLSTSIGLYVAQKADEAAAWYLYQHVIDAYKFLMESYRVGDSICIFGFSRGAFTGRALAGMLHCVGLLPKHNLEHIPFAYEMYKNVTDYNHTGKADEDAKKFKETFCIPVAIDFVGVWDTVASVGALFPKSLQYIDYNPSILTFRQALALDERRGNFIPSVWDHGCTIPLQQDVREVWFKGEHSDIGGGSVAPQPKGKDTEGNPTYKHTMLSNISLRWMVRQVIGCKTGILFDNARVELYRKNGILEPSVLDHSVLDHSQSEEESADDIGTSNWSRRIEESIKLDQEDIKQAIYDSIGEKPWWNLLEISFLGKPTKTAEVVTGEVETAGSNELKFEPGTTYWPNLRNGRSIYSGNLTHPIFLHSSVLNYLMLKDAEDPKKVAYKPRAKWQGYSDEQGPRIEDTIYHSEGVNTTGNQPHPNLDKEVASKLNMVPLVTKAPETKWWRFGLF